MNAWTGLVFTFKSYYVPIWKHKRTRVFIFFSLLPLLITMLVYFAGISTGLRGTWQGEIYFSNFLAYYLQFFSPLLALFTGVSLLGDEIDDRTIIYLTGSAFPRFSILTGKFLALSSVMILVAFAGFLPAMLLTGMVLDRSAVFLETVNAGGVLALSTLAYCALFTFLGIFMKRAVLFGLLLVFGWENVVQYLPGLTQKLTVNYYVKSLLPNLQQSKGPFAFLMQPATPLAALLVLLFIALIFLFAAGLIFSFREYGSQTVND